MWGFWELVSVIRVRGASKFGWLSIGVANKYCDVGIRGRWLGGSINYIAETTYFPVAPSLWIWVFPCHSISLVIKFSCCIMHGCNITAVCIRLLKRLPLLGSAWRVFPFSHWASEPRHHAITQARGLNIAGCVSSETPCSPLLTITINDSFKQPGSSSWSDPATAATRGSPTAAAAAAGCPTKYRTVNGVLHISSRDTSVSLPTTYMLLICMQISNTCRTNDAAISLGWTFLFSAN